MVKYLTVRQHKGIREICLKELGHINSICGPNNSGKTALLEAIASRDVNKCSLGKMIDESGAVELDKLFEPQSDRYSNPYPKISRRWFAQAIRRHLGQVMYEHEQQSWVQKLREQLADDPELRNQGREIFNFQNVFRPFLEPIRNDFTQVLVSADRELVTSHSVTALTSPTTSLGIELLKSLYRLKSRGRGSSEYSIFLSIEQAFSDITDGYQFDVFLNSTEDMKIQFSRNGSMWILAEDSGFGFRHLLTILYHVLASKENVILIEEPEIHIHPDIQRRLLRFLDSRADKQFFLSTHSNVFLDTTYVDKIMFTTLSDGKVSLSDQTTKTEILLSLGYSAIDNLLSDAIIITEGPLDRPILQVLADRIGLSKTFYVKYWPLGGDIMAQVDLSVISESKRVFAIIDSDPQSHKIRKRFEENCGRYEIPCHKLERYAIENYLSVRAIKAVFPDKSIPEKFDDMRSVREQLGFSVKKNGGRIAEQMSIDEWSGSDLFDFFQQIQRTLESGLGKTVSGPVGISTLESKAPADAEKPEAFLLEPPS